MPKQNQGGAGLVDAPPKKKQKLSLTATNKAAIYEAMGKLKPSRDLASTQQYDTLYQTAAQLGAKCDPSLPPPSPATLKRWLKNYNNPKPKTAAPPPPPAPNRAPNSPTTANGGAKNRTKRGLDVNDLSAVQQTGTDIKSNVVHAKPKSKPKQNAGRQHGATNKTIESQITAARTT